MGEADDMADIGLTAQAFVAARQSARALAAYPGAIPSSLAIAYTIQNAAIEAYGSTVAGWKVGRVLPPLDAQYGTTRLAGPIFVETIQLAEPTPAMPVFAGGFAAVEAEFLFRLDGDIDPAKLYWTVDEALARVSAVHVGIEIASSPFAGINVHGPCVTASDFGNNFGLVVGDRIDEWRGAALDDWDVSMTIDGTSVGNGRASAFPGGCAESVRFLLEHLASRRIAIAAGTWVSTGAISGVHEIAPGMTATATFGGGASVSCDIVAATPAVGGE